MVTTEMDNRNHKFESIQALRGFACILVVLCHTSYTNFGAFGVDFFLVISGFITMYATEKSTEKFLCKRIIKIVPLYWFMTLVTGVAICLFPGLFNSSEVNLIYLLKSFFFIPFENSLGNRNPVLQIGWFLNYEMLFYLLFWISTKVNHLKRGLITGTMCAFLTLVCCVRNVPMPFLFYSGGYLLEFCYGIILYVIYIRFEKANSSKKTKRLTILYYIILFVGCCIMDRLMRSIRPCFGSGFVAALIVIFMLLNENAIWHPEILKKIGNASWCIYLIHPYPVRIIDNLCSGFLGGWGIIVDITVSCIFGVIWNRHVEMPIQNTLKRKIIYKS